MCTPGSVARIFTDGRTLHIKRLQSTLDLTDLDLTDFGFYRSVSIDCCTCNCYKQKSIDDETRNRATLSQRHNDSPFTCIVTSQDVSVSLFSLFSLFCSLSFSAVVKALRFRLTDFFQQRTVVGPHLSVKPRFDCIWKIQKVYQRTVPVRVQKRRTVPYYRTVLPFLLFVQTS